MRLATGCFRTYALVYACNCDLIWLNSRCESNTRRLYLIMNLAPYRVTFFLLIIIIVVITTGIVGRYSNTDDAAETSNRDTPQTPLRHSDRKF